MVAWALAAWHPERVASLTALSQAHPAAMAAAVRTSSQGLRSWYVAAFQVPVLPELVLLRRGVLERLLVRSELPEHLARRYAERAAEPGRLTAAIGWYRALPFGGRPVGRVVVPVTYLHGWRDPFYAPATVLGTAGHVTGPLRAAHAGHRPLGAGAGARRGRGRGPGARRLRGGERGLRRRTDRQVSPRR
ncbi:MAG: hypothetical protein PGN11_16580 [Quadrisphaera sp.]